MPSKVNAHVAQSNLDYGVEDMLAALNPIMC